MGQREIRFIINTDLRQCLLYPSAVHKNSFRAVGRLASYARHVHAKDFAPAVSDGFLTRGGRRIRGTVIGEGMIPIAPCLGALLHAGYDGYVTVEYEGSEDALAAIARGKANLEALLKTVGA